MKSCGYCLGHVDAGSELLKKVHKLPWELDFDHHAHHKESRTFDPKYVRIKLSLNNVITGANSQSETLYTFLTLVGI